MSEDDFSDVPKTVLEERAERAQQLGGAIWTPRDVLISMLRDIDRGTIKPESMVLVYRTSTQPGHTRVSWMRSAPDHETSIGMLMEAIMKMHRLPE